MASRFLAMASSMFALLATSVFAQTPAPFYGANGPDPNRWYHIVEFGEGDAAERTRSVYDRIERSAKPRRDPQRLDTVINYGPGHWTYEWEQEAAKLEARARAAERAGDRSAAERAYAEAAKAYAVGSAPHLRTDPLAMAALAKARAAYQAGARLAPGEFRVLRISYAGKSFEAYLHLPPGKGPFPLVVASNGSDVVKEQTSAVLRRELLRRGIALVSLDLPGIGGGGEYDLTPETDALHVAAVRYMRANPIIDPAKIAVMGTSFGGNAAARALLRPDLELAAVVFACGPVHTAFTLPPQAYGLLPALVRDGVRDRVGLPPAASLDKLAAKIRGFSIKEAAAGGRVSTPLLILATDADPVAPLQDLPILAETTNRTTTIVYRRPGHCPDPMAAQPAAAVWLEERFASIGATGKARQ